jgi:CMP-2-keto-3-deoxyoctulosonic acid synthetase
LSGGVLGIVPARLASTRLPNKPLYPILGRPLIEWVWRRVEAMTVLDHAVVATGDLIAPHLNHLLALLFRPSLRSP